MTGAARSAACFRAFHRFVASWTLHLPDSTAAPCSREGKSPKPALCSDLSSEWDGGSTAAPTAQIAPMPSDGGCSISTLGDRNHPAKRQSPRKSEGHRAVGAAEHSDTAPPSQGPTAALILQPKPDPWHIPRHPWSIKGAAGGPRMAGIQPHLAAPLQGVGTGRSWQLCAHSRARAELIPGSRTTATHCHTDFQGRALLQHQDGAWEGWEGFGPADPQLSHPLRPREIPSTPM